MKIIEDLGQILVVLHTLLVIIEMTPRLNKQREILGSEMDADVMMPIVRAVEMSESHSGAPAWMDNSRNHETYTI